MWWCGWKYLWIHVGVLWAAWDQDSDLGSNAAPSLGRWMAHLKQASAVEGYTNRFLIGLFRD